MKIVRGTSSNMTPQDPLSDSRALALLVTRSKVFLSENQDRKKAKQYNQLIAALEKLLRISRFTQPEANQSSQQAENSPFCDGVPRWTLQIEEHFAQYANSSFAYQAEWTKRRVELWKQFEFSIPPRVREQLMSWRWKAEQQAFRRMKSELDEAKNKVDKIEKRLDKEQKNFTDGRGFPGLFDRLMILKWSKEAQENEQTLSLLEVEKQKKLEELSQVLQDCEILAAQIALEMKTTLVDCGEYCSTVFEEFTRTIDSEIKTQLNYSVDEINRENEILRQKVDSKNKTHQIEFDRNNSMSEKLNRVLNEEWDKKLEDAKELVQREFLVLNSMEIETQDEAMVRWKTAVTKMNHLLKTAEESLCYGRAVD